MASFTFTLSTETLRSSVTQEDVTWTFSEPKLTRQTVDGAWVVEGPVSITSVTPAVSGSGTTLRNGLMVDPLWENDTNYVGQAWDGRDTTQFDGTLEESSFPLALSADSCAVKCVSQLTLATSGAADRVGYPASSAALFVVSDISALPSGEIFSPSPIGWTGRTGFDWWRADVPGAVAALPSYDTTGHTGSVTYAALAPNLVRYQAMAGFSTSLSDAGMQAWLAHLTGDASNYGQFVYKLQERAAMGMIGNEWTTADKESMMVALASTGVHLLQLGAGDSTYYAKMPLGVGGLAQWEQIPADCAILCSTDAQTADLHLDLFSAMLLQPFQFTAPLVARLAPHTGSTDPMDYRERPVISIDTTDPDAHTVRVSMILGGERYRWEADSVKIMKSTDGLVSSLVRSTGPIITNGEEDIPVEDASGFSGKTVYFESVMPFEVGEYSWNVSDYRVAFNRFDLAPITEYIAGNSRWAGWSLFAMAAGLADAQRTPAIRWTEQRSLGYRGINSAPYETEWAREFWADYSASLITSTIGANTFGTIPPPLVSTDWKLLPGIATNDVDVTLFDIPEYNGTVTGVEYDVDGADTWASSLPSYSGAGTYTISLPSASTSYDIRLRLTNAAGDSYPTDAKTVTSGPKVIAASFPVMEAAATTEAGLSTSHTINLPTGISSGDLIVLEFFCAAAQVPTVSGFTAEFSSSPADNLVVLTKTATGSEGTSIAASLSSSSRIAVVARRFSGWSDIEFSTTSTTAFDTPNLFPSNGEDKILWVSSAGGTASDWSVSAAPSGFTGLLVEKNASSSADSRCGLASAYKTEQVRSLDPGSFTFSGSPVAKYGVTYAVIPA